MAEETFSTITDEVFRQDLGTSERICGEEDENLTIIIPLESVVVNHPTFANWLC